jgi:predicted dehydrogenase
MTLRLIQVGLGGWGQNWFNDILSPYQGVEVVAWVEIDPQAQGEAQQKLKLPRERCFLHLEEALEQVQADAVLITASLPGHVPSARIALGAQKHVLLEKPFAPTLAEAQELVALAAQHERILMISQNYRFAPAVQKVRELVREGRFGPVSSVLIDFRKFSNTAPVATNRHYHIWQPLLVDMAIHHFDLMRAVLGQEPRQVMCQTWNPGWSNFVDPPAAAMTITFDGGTVVSYRGSWISQGSPTNWGGEWRMDCEKGQLDWTSRGEIPDRVTVRPQGKRPRSAALPALEFRDRSGSLDAFVRACRSGEAPESSGQDNLKTLAFLLAVVKAAETGLPVTIS